MITKGFAVLFAGELPVLLIKYIAQQRTGHSVDEKMPKVDFILPKNLGFILPSDISELMSLSELNLSQCCLPGTVGSSLYCDSRFN